MSFNSGSASNRSSIFETFSAVSLRGNNNDDDEEALMTMSGKPVKSVSRRRSFEEERLGEQIFGGGGDDVDCVEEDVTAATLFMSCSPGRASSDDEDSNIQWLDNLEEEPYDMHDDTDFIPETSKSKKKKKSIENPQIKKKKLGETTGEKKAKKSSMPKKDSKKSPAPVVKKKPSGSSDKTGKSKVPGLKEPKKPLSAYALFYRDSQSLIKAESPTLSFGEVSKIVATMWDRLEPAEKAVYNSQSEEDRKVYMEELKEYRAAVKEHEEKTKEKLKKKNSDTKSKKKLSASAVAKEILSDDDDFINDDDDDDEVDEEDEEEDDSIPSSEEDVPSDSESHATRQNLTNTLCARRNCPNRAVEDPRWCKEYCSAQCVVSHCRDVFTTWVAQRKDNNGIMVDAA